MSKAKMKKLAVTIVILTVAAWAVISVAQPNANDIESKAGGACDNWCYLYVRAFIECHHNSEYGPCEDHLCNIDNCLGVKCNEQEIQEGCDFVFDPDAYRLHRYARRIGEGNCIPPDPSGGYKPTVCSCWGNCALGPIARGRCFFNDCYGELLNDWFQYPGNMVCANPE